MRHFPDKLPEGRLPSREYFFNIMMTGMPEYLASLIKHANEARHAAHGEAIKHETILVSDEMMEQLNSMPYISKKRGKTVHLLKEKTKPVVMNKKRRKISLLQLPGMNLVPQIPEPGSE
jgi:hypothetical protein